MDTPQYLGLVTSHMRQTLRSVIADAGGVALIEFAYVAPVLAALGLCGMEVANMSATRTQVSQIALSLADNAARLGQTDNSGVTPTVGEADVDALMDGMMREGASINLQQRGRIIISSLEYDEYSRKQYIHWQRCRGDKTDVSAYGNDTAKNGLTGAEIPGMGSGASKVKAEPKTAVMYVEIFYEYQGLFTNMLVNKLPMKQEAAMLIRDDRNLAPGLVGGNSKSKC